MEFDSSSNRRLIRWPTVHARTGRSRVQVWRDIKIRRFPAPVQIGPNAIGWFEDEIDAWLAKRPRVAYAPGECRLVEAHKVRNDPDKAHKT